MVHTYTFVLVVLCFIVTTYFSEKHFKRTPPKMGVMKILIINVAIEFLLLSLVVIVPKLFPILIYGSVIVACYVCAFSRHKQIGKIL